MRIESCDEDGELRMEDGVPDCDRELLRHAKGFVVVRIVNQRPAWKAAHPPRRAGCDDELGIVRTLDEAGLAGDGDSLWKGIRRVIRDW
jgi:hypothetical protein